MYVPGVTQTQTVLITGGAGFLGVNLARYLLSEDPCCRRVVILDNFRTSSRENVHSLSKEFPGRVDLFQVDITRKEEMEFLVDLYWEEPISHIYHLASIASPPLYSKFPLETLECGYTGTKVLLQLIIKMPLKPRLLFASSSEVYGQPQVHPQREDYYGNVNPYGNRSCYDESKRVGETLIRIYKELYNLDTRIVRIFNTYGPYMNLDDGRIVTEIIRSYIRNKPLKIFGDGNQTRCFNYVDDTVRSIITVMRGDCDSPVNVGSDTEISVNSLVETFEVIIGRRLEKEYIHIDKDDPLLRKPDLTRLKEIYWNVKKTHPEFTPIQRGLSDTLEYFLQLTKETPQQYHVL